MCRRISSHALGYQPFLEFVQEYNLWKYTVGKQQDMDELNCGQSYIKTCGMCAATCVFCGSAFLLSDAVVHPTRESYESIYRILHQF